MSKSLTSEDLELLRVARGTGVVSLNPATIARLESLWNRGLVRRDDVPPYTFTTVDDVANQLGESDADQEGECRGDADGD